jgi:signal transduction histidine kinase
MSSLPRFLALALFVVLAALVATLAVPVWRGSSAAPVAAGAGDRAVSVPAPATATTTGKVASRGRALVLSQQVGLALAATALALVLTLVLALAWRPARPGGSQSPMGAARVEFGTLARLAESSNAQSAELSRERGVRRRAEEDAQLRQQLLAHSLEEKARLGRDLHDGIIQSLYAVGLNLESVRALVKQDPVEADRRMEELRERLNAAIREVRACITGLAPEHLRRATFAQAVDAALEELRSGREVHFDVKIDDAAAARLTPEQAVEALQIVREAVSNALRHGGASVVTLRVHCSDREVCLLVQDDGIGFDPDNRRPDGHGLGNMQARAERLGATLRVSSRPGEGARIVTTLPILQSTTA